MFGSLVDGGRAESFAKELRIELSPWGDRKQDAHINSNVLH